MKNLKLIFLALGCMAALSLTSCLKDSDDDYNNGLTPAQISQCYNAVKGSYTGKLVYPSSDTKYGYTDTIDVSWSIGADTMLVINSFSSKVIAEQIKDTELKEALLQEEQLSVLKNYLHFIKNDSEVQFLLAPQTIEFPVFYKDKTKHSKNYLQLSAPLFSEYVAEKFGFEKRVHVRVSLTPETFPKKQQDLPAAGFRLYFNEIKK